MKKILAVVVIGLTSFSSAVSAHADPLNNPNTVALTEQCSNGRSYTFLISPASGSSVLDTNGTTVQVTFSLAVSDPLNELGGPFEIPLKVGIPEKKVISCTGSVIGTQEVTFTAEVLLTPQRSAS